GWGDRRVRPRPPGRLTGPSFVESRMSLALLDKIRRVENLPPLPTVAAEVLQLGKRPSANAADLARIVSRDPAMTARVLTLVNSPLFGIPTAVRSVQQAISLLGMRSVTVTILSLALV